jgi:hypothetical protein
MTVDRHAEFRTRGVFLRIFVRGEDMTHRCRFWDDTIPYAELYRHDARGVAFLDEDGEPAVEQVWAEVEIREEVLA